MRYAILSIFVLLSSCTSVEQVIDNKELYCSQFYKGVRAVGRSALSATTMYAILSMRLSRRKTLIA
jgi:uncharacterized protein YceK